MTGRKRYLRLAQIEGVGKAAAFILTSPRRLPAHHRHQRAQQLLLAFADIFARADQLQRRSVQALRGIYARAIASAGAIPRGGYRSHIPTRLHNVPSRSIGAHGAAGLANDGHFGCGGIGVMIVHPSIIEAVSPFRSDEAFYCIQRHTDQPAHQRSIDTDEL